MTSQSTRVESLLNHLQGAVPPRFAEEVGDHVHNELDPVADSVLLILIARGIKRPVYEHWATDDIGSWDESPVAAVFADITIISHAEVRIGRDHDLASLNVRTHGEDPLLGKVHSRRRRELGKIIAVAGVVVLGTG